MVSVKDHGATGDGTTDDRAAILMAIAALGSTDRHLHFPAGRYKASKYLPLSSVDGLTITGAGATLLIQSADTNIQTDATATTATMARSGLLAIDCDDLTIRDLACEGSAAEVDITVNVGCGVYLKNCARPRLNNLRQWYGGSILNQEAQANDAGLIVRDCHVYGVRGNLVPGPNALIDGCSFELPTDEGYHRVGNNGSSHAVYLYAGRSNVKVTGCSFKNIRTTGVKGSGSALPLRDLLVDGCTFADCGSGVLWGADDAQEHTGLIVQGNAFVNCGTNVSGWTQGAALVIYGSRASIVRGNVVRYTRACLGTLSAVKGFQIQRYTGGRACEAVLVQGNQFSGYATDGPSVSGILTHAIYANDVSGLVVESNQVQDMSTVAIFTTGCDRPVVTRNTISNAVTSVQSVSDVAPVIRDNFERVGAATSGNATFRIHGPSNGLERVENLRQLADGTFAAPVWAFTS